MGLFQKQPKEQSDALDAATDQQKRFFDDYFREELRNHGRWYFQKVIKENGDLFKEDLEAVITKVKTDLSEHVSRQLDGAITQISATLKEHVSRQIDTEFAEYSKTMQEAQDAALKNMTDGSNELKQQYQELSSVLKDNINEQNDMMHHAFEDHKSQLQSMDDAQAQALKTLGSSVEALQQQYQQMGQMLTTQVSEQRERIIGTFEDNMATVVEGYVLGALGDQYDLKAQLPAIMKQLEENKQTMVEDIKL